MLECNHGNNDLAWFLTDFYHRSLSTIPKVSVYAGHKTIPEGNGKSLFMKFLFFSTIHTDVYQYISISFLQNCKFFFVRILNSATLQFCIKSIEHKIPGYELSLYYLILKKKSMIFISRKNSSNFLRNPIFLTIIL